MTLKDQLRTILTRLDRGEYLDTGGIEQAQADIEALFAQQLQAAGELITCTVCGRESVPNWDGKGHCITCARDLVLGPSKQTDGGDTHFNFVYKRDGFTIPMQAVWNSLSPLQQECLSAYLEARERAARYSERKRVALDNYQGQTFSDSTNWHGKFEKFIENNERRLRQLTQPKEGKNDAESD
jgi:hypothetical protein